MQFVPAFSSNGNNMFPWKNTTNGFASVVGANGSLHTQVLGNNQDTGAVSGTLFGSYWGAGDSVKLFFGAGGSLACEGASSDNASISHGIGAVQAGNLQTNQDYVFFTPDGSLVCSQLNVYGLGSKPAWVP
jgi:hypothetical protein